MCAGSYIAAFYLRYGNFPAKNFTPFVDLAPWLAVLTVLTMGVTGMYEQNRRRWFDLMVSVSLSTTLLTLSNMSLSFAAYRFAFPRSVFAIAWVLGIVAFTVWRLVFRWLTWLVEGTKRVWVVGPHAELMADRLAEEVGTLVWLRTTFASAVVPSAQELEVKTDEYDVVCLTPGIPHEQRVGLASICLHLRKELFVVPDLYDIVVQSAGTGSIGDIVILEMKGLGLTPAQQVT
jgi:FlaA1/EpsC-like NDP-sugar epimerase